MVRIFLRFIQLMVQGVRFGKEEEEVNMYVATLVLRERNLRQR